MNFQSIGINVHDRVGCILGCLDHAFDIEVVDSLMLLIVAGVVVAVEVGHRVFVLLEHGDELF